MTVASTIAESSFTWTGVESVFSAGFPAMDIDDVVAEYTKDNVTVTLTRGLHYSVSLASGSRMVTVLPVSMPTAPGTLRLRRRSAFLQPDVFVEGEGIPASTHQFQHDHHVMRLQELRRDIDRALTQLSSGGVSTINRRQAFKALKANTTAGVNWLTAVQNAIGPLESADDNIDYSAWFWPAGGAMWLRVQSILNSALVGGFSTAQRQALEAQAASIVG